MLWKQQKSSVNRDKMNWKTNGALLGSRLFSLDVSMVMELRHDMQFSACLFILDNRVTILSIDSHQVLVKVKPMEIFCDS